MPTSPVASKLSVLPPRTILPYVAPRRVSPSPGLANVRGCVSHSTPEAEMVSADFPLRHCGLPCLSMWWTLLPGKPKL
eukprot:11455808-Heterocapsa_arctica.AAC.1